MAEQTAVEWLEEKMKKLTPPGYQTEISAMLEKAKKMEKEQISQGYMSGLIDAMNQQPKEYYNETYGKE